MVYTIPLVDTPRTAQRKESRQLLLSQRVLEPPFDLPLDPAIVVQTGIDETELPAVGQDS